MPKNQKGLAPILIVILVVLIVGGYFVYSNYSTNQTQPEPTETPNPDETAGWQTYINTEYKYSLKYPQGWTVEAKGDSDITTFPAPLFVSI